MLYSRAGSWLKMGWTAAFEGCFLLLCFRFEIAAFRQAYPWYWPAAALTAGGFCVGFWRPGAAMFAFTAGMLLLSALGQSAALYSTTPASLVFCGIWIGIRTMRFGKFQLGKAADNAWERNNRAISLYSAKPGGITIARVITELLIAGVLISLLLQLIKYKNSPGFYASCLNTPVFGFGDVYYFLTAAFLWLQGMFYFRELLALSDSRGPKMDVIVKWIRPVFAIYISVLFLSFIYQAVFHIPYAPQVFAA
jgi:hypothetical protein